MHRNGFSLVELSIVLVILGLLVGGILAGQSLIRASELRAVGTEHQRYTTAISAFRDKYFALPGDMPNATNIWGALVGTCATVDSTGSILTCDGNGNGFVATGNTSNERYRFWQHLSNASLIEGTYSGISGPNNNYTTMPSNSPNSKLSGAYWMAVDFSGHDGTAASSNEFETVYGNILQFGGLIANNHNYAGVMRPEEAWNVDTKLDDGMPGRGRLVTNVSTNCTATTTNSNLNQAYNLTGTAAGCMFRFIRQF